VGSGDSRKSTILDAIEAALSSRWCQFTDADSPPAIKSTRDVRDSRAHSTSVG
jgi:hypothetical protein